jgi:hypothetical protein
VSGEADGLGGVVAKAKTPFGAVEPKGPARQAVLVHELPRQGGGEREVHSAIIPVEAFEAWWLKRGRLTAMKRVFLGYASDLARLAAEIVFPHDEPRVD